MNTDVIFSILFVIFSAVMILAGVITRKWVSETSDYILAGREVSLPINVMGVAAIGFAGTSISLAPGFSIMSGLLGSIMWGVIYAAFGLVFYGLVFSKFIRRSGAQTLPEYLELRYSGKVRSIVAIGTIVGLCGILANNIVSCVGVVSGFIGWSPVLVTAIIFGIIIIFTTMSGLWAATITDLFQVSIGTIAVPLFLFLSMKKFGGLDAISKLWIGGDMYTQGLTGNSLSILSLKYPSVLTFILLFSTALVMGNNYYWMKIASCRSEKVARNSFVIAGVYLIIVFMVPLSIIGAYAGAVSPEAYTMGGGTALPTAAYGVFAKLFAPLVSSLFIVGAIAASVSTSSTAAIGATSSATRDIYQRLLRPNADAKTTLAASKVIMFLVGAFTWLLTFFPGGPTYLFAFANSWLVPPAVLLILGALWPRFNNKGAMAGVVAGIVTMAALTFLDLSGIFHVNNYTHLAIIGFLVTVAFGVVFTFMGESKYYGRPGWQIHSISREVGDKALGEREMQILELIRIGHGYMSDITDALGVDSRTSHESIELLDQAGYIERLGLTGSNFFTFKLTEKGRNALPAFTPEEQRLAEVGLTEDYVQLLTLVRDESARIPDFIKAKGWKSLKVSSVTTHLVRLGYAKETGLFLRYLQLEPKGKQVLEALAR